MYTTRLWKDRQVEKPNRWKFSNDGGTEVKYYTAERAEGTIDIIGDSINAENMNDLETRINSAFNAEAANRAEDLEVLDNSIHGDMSALESGINSTVNAAITNVTATVSALNLKVDNMITFDSTTHKMTVHL